MELNFKGDKPGWKKSEPVERFYIKYDPKENLPSHEGIIPNQREKDVKALESAVCVTRKANQNLTHSQKELLLRKFRLGHIGFQHVQWLICTWSMKVQVNSKVMVNCESTKCTDCEFLKGRC